MPGSEYFHEKRKNSLNSFTNEEAAKDWTPDHKYLMEVSDVIKRASMDIHDGILTKFSTLRTRQLEAKIGETCYSKKNATLEEAESCEKFTFDNDYKLN